MIAALIAGERDGAKLAELAMGKMRPKVPPLTEALAGHLGSHHAVACRRILRHLDFLNESIAALTEQIDQRTARSRPSTRRCCRCRQRSKEPRDGAAPNLILISNHDETEST